MTHNESPNKSLQPTPDGVGSSADAGHVVVPVAELLSSACKAARMVTRKKILVGSSVVVAVLALLAIPAYQPLKFHYAIWRIESAATPAQERSACILASRVGHVVEVNQIRPNDFASRTFPSRVQPRVTRNNDA